MHKEHMKYNMDFVAYLFLFWCIFQEIHAGYNSIQELSAEFVESIPGVKILDLRDNKISEIPDNILLLQALERFDVTNNNLSKYVQILSS